MSQDQTPAQIAFEDARKELDQADLACAQMLQFLDGLDLRQIMGDAQRKGLVDQDEYEQMFEYGLCDNGMTIRQAVEHRKAAERRLVEAMRQIF